MAKLSASKTPFLSLQWQQCPTHLTLTGPGWYRRLLWPVHLGGMRLLPPPPQPFRCPASSRLSRRFRLYAVTPWLLPGLPAPSPLPPVPGSFPPVSSGPCLPLGLTRSRWVNRAWRRSSRGRAGVSLLCCRDAGRCRAEGAKNGSSHAVDCRLILALDPLLALPGEFCRV